MPKIWKIAIMNFKKWAISPRIYIVASMILVFTNMVTSPLVDFAKTFNEKISPWLLVYIMSDSYMLIIFFVCLIILFCDAPFIDEQQPYVIIRSGRKRWVLGQILYIVLASLAFTLFLFFSVCVNIISVIDFSPEWGKIIGTLAQTDAAAQFNSYISFDYSIMVNYGAVQAAAIVMLTVWLVSVLLGLLIFYINSHLGRVAGSVTGFALVLMQYLIPIIRVDFLYYISPVSWVNLSEIDVKGISFYPGFDYIFPVLCVAILILIIASVHTYKRWEIKTQIQI